MPARISPGTELHLAALVVEGEPRDVNLARGLEDARGDVEAVAVAGHHNLGGVGAVEAFVRTGSNEIQKSFVGMFVLIE